MKKEKILYTCEKEINAYEYGKMAKYFPQIYWSFVLYGMVINLLFLIVSVIFSDLPIVNVIFFVIMEICILINNKFKLRYSANKILFCCK